MLRCVVTRGGESARVWCCVVKCYGELFWCAAGAAGVSGVSGAAGTTGAAADVQAWLVRHLQLCERIGVRAVLHGVAPLARIADDADAFALEKFGTHLSGPAGCHARHPRAQP